jgi:predicted nucleotidyltransferase
MRPAADDPSLAALCRRFHVRRLDLFGSAIGDAFDATSSDLDFLVEFETLEPARYADAYFGLREALEHLFQRPVDLVTDASLSNPYFRRRVLSERQLLYQAA